jgi:hypothetical protein
MQATDIANLATATGIEVEDWAECAQRQDKGEDCVTGRSLLGDVVDGRIENEGSKGVASTKEPCAIRVIGKITDDLAVEGVVKGRGNGLLDAAILSLWLNSEVLCTHLFLAHGKQTSDGVVKMREQLGPDLIGMEVVTVECNVD